MSCTTTAPRPASAPNSQDLKRRAAFAKAAVYSEFRGRDALALNQDAFVDRVPDKAPRLHIETDTGREVALDHLAAALQLDDDDAGPST